MWYTLCQGNRTFQSDEQGRFYVLYNIKQIAKNLWEMTTKFCEKILNCSDSTIDMRGGTGELEKNLWSETKK